MPANGKNHVKTRFSVGWWITITSRGLLRAHVGLWSVCDIITAGSKWLQATVRVFGGEHPIQLASPDDYGIKDQARQWTVPHESIIVDPQIWLLDVS